MEESKTALLKNLLEHFSRYVCYPKDNLLEGECKPKLVVLTDEDIRKLDPSDLNNISKLFVENNKYLYTEQLKRG